MKPTVLNIDIYPEISPCVNVAETDEVEGAVGPGSRLAIWLQGCQKRCPGCINELFVPLAIRRLFSVDELKDKLDRTPNLAGIGLSGGEPVLQAKSLIPFLEEVRKRGLTTVCYTGYRIEELEAPEAPSHLKRFLSLVDMLVDGEYRADLPRGGPYRASSNQRVNLLTGRIARADIERQAENVFCFDQEKTKWTGTPQEKLFHTIEKKLEDRGVFMNMRDSKNIAREMSGSKQGRI